MSCGLDRQAILADGPSLLRDRDRIDSAEVPSRHAVPVRLDFSYRSLGHHAATTNSRPGSEIDNVVGRSYRFLVVLDHDHGVALVPQIGKALQQQLIVAWMEPDRGFIQDVDDTDQSAADLSGQADSLGFAAGECRGGSVQGEIVESTAEEEAKPGSDFLEHIDRDQLSGRVEFDVLEERSRLADRQPTDFRQAATSTGGCPTEMVVGRGDRDGLSLLVEPCSVAGRAVGELHRLLQLPPSHGIVCLVVRLEQLGDHAGKRAAVLPDPAPVAPGECDVTIAGSVKDQPSRLVAEVFPGRFQYRIGFESEIGLDGRCGTLVNVSPPAADAPDSPQ